jgi:PAS domain S-box-containing protein
MGTEQNRERLFELLVGSIRDYAIFILDLEGRILTWNRGARAIKGYEPEEIIGRSFEVFYTSEQRERGHPKYLLALARAEGSVEDEGWRLRKDGTKFWADVVITALYADNGEHVGYGKVTRDLTEKRRTEELRFESEQRFRMIVDAVDDYAIFMLDRTGHVATWNRGAARIKGYRADEVIGKHLSTFYPPEAVASGYPERELEIAVQQGRFEEEGWRVRKDGSRFWANVVLTPVTNSAGEHVGFAKVTRDLTERREAEEERLRLAQAQEAVRLRDEFLSIASHELRTPLTAVLLQLESAQRLVGDTNDKLAHKLDRAARSGGRLSELVDALLDVARISSGHITLTTQVVDLAAVVTEVVDRMSEMAAKANCKLATSLETGIIGHWDALRMEQLVGNVISNALRYASGTEIDVSLERRGERAVLKVCDRGPGIAPEHQERVFGRFERASDLRHHGGLGLGLYLAREITTAHGGTIRAFNREHGGVVVEVDLPATGSVA